MKVYLPKILILSWALLIGSPLGFAQCNFDVATSIQPVVADNIYCTYDTITLSASDTFETYQWYYNFSASNQGGTAITGATGRSFTTTAGELGFVYYYLEASRENCVEVSTPILVDTWFFLSPVIISYPQAQYCRGDSSMIAIGSGLWDSIQWYRDNDPIPLAQDSIYWVKETGSYPVIASPSLCPALRLSSGLGPSFVFEGPEPPTISLQNDTLMATSGPMYQWFQNGQLIPGATGPFYLPTESGSYTVQVDDGSTCTVTSSNFDFMLSPTTKPAASLGIQLFPNPAQHTLKIRSLPEGLSHLDILDPVGKLLRRMEVRERRALDLNISNLNPGLYFCRFSIRGHYSYLSFLKN